MESIIQISAITLLLGLLALWGISFYKGRKIAQYLQKRHQSKWESLGKPRPAYLSPINNQQWSKFISEKLYLSIPDKDLEKACRTQQKLEKLTLMLTLAFFAIFGSIALWYKVVS